MILKVDAVSPRLEAGDQPHEPRRCQLPVVRRAIVSKLSTVCRTVWCVLLILSLVFLCKFSGVVSEPVLIIMNHCDSRKLERDYAAGWTNGESAVDYWQGCGLHILYSIRSVSETSGL
jgi:hypothetical protein